MFSVLTVSNEKKFSKNKELYVGENIGLVYKFGGMLGTPTK